MMELIDSHCHLDYEPLLAKAGQWLERGRTLGIVQTLVPATTYARFPALIDFVQAHASTLLALGLHPIYLPEHSDDVLNEVEDWLVRAKPCAIGEVGLDYYVEELDRGRQQIVFERMIDYAAQFALPLILHVRRAHDAVLATLKRKKFVHGGIVHAFAGSKQQAEQFIAMGFKLGFGGVMTYSNASRVRTLAAELPLSSIVLETDAPDMKPVDWPIDFNTPLALINNFQALCALRSESVEMIAAQTTANARAILMQH